MSTTARKARKRQRHNDLALHTALAARGLPTDSVFVHPPFQHPVKISTPIADRAVNVRRREAAAARAVSPGVIARVARYIRGLGRSDGE